MLKDLQKEIETTFWMRYEKRKMKECVNTLHNLASAFLIEEKQEEEKDRYRLFLKKRLKENRILVADHLKEIAKIIDNVAEEKFVIEVLPQKQEKQLAKLLLTHETFDRENRLLWVCDSLTFSWITNFTLATLHECHDRRCSSFTFTVRYNYGFVTLQDSYTRVGST